MGRNASHSWALMTSASGGTNRGATFGMSSQKRRANARLPAGNSSTDRLTRANLEPIGDIGELAVGHEVVAGDRDAMTAFGRVRLQARASAERRLRLPAFPPT